MTIGAEPELLNFLVLLIDKHRMPAIFRIRDRFEELWAVENKRLEVTVTSAVELEPELVERIGRCPACVAHGGIVVRPRGAVAERKIAGLVHRKDGKLELSPRGLRAIGNSALRELFSKLSKDKFGQHRIARDGSGHERTYDSKPYEFGDPFRLDLQRTIRNAISRNGSGTPVKLSPEDFEIERTEHNTRSSTVLMIDLSMSMPMRGNFVPAKKVAMALHSLISSQFPRDYLGLVGFSETAHIMTHEQLPEVSWDLAYGTNMQHGLRLARQLLARQTGTKQIIMITDGEPTAHITQSGDVYFNYPPVRETVEATLREAMRCTKDNITINTFVLDATGPLRHFIEQMAQVNHGRAFFTTPETLGDYVLVDFLENRRRTSRAR